MCLSNWRHGYKLRGLGFGLTAVVTVICLWSVAALAQPITFDTIALTGTDGAFGPGLGPGAEYRFLSTASLPFLNNTGMVTFNSTLTGTGINGDGGMWVGGDRPLTMVARSGTDGLLGPNLGTGITFGEVGGWANDAGDLLIRGNVSGFGGFVEGLFLKPDGGSLNPIARTVTDGPLGPGLGAGVNFTGFGGLRMNSNTEVVLHAGYGGALFGNGFWKYAEGSLSALFRTGTDGPLGPGLGPGVEFGTLVNDGTHFTLNASGQIAVQGSLAVAGNNDVVWLSNDGSPVYIAREGDQAPIDPAIAPNITYQSLFGVAPILNDSGQMVFGARLTGFGAGEDGNRNRGIFLLDDGTVTAIASGFTDGPFGPGLGPGVEFAALTGSRINAAGQVVFFTSLLGPGVNDDNRFGLWMADGGSPQIVARGGTDGPLGPGLGSGITFETGPFPVMNAHGWLAAVTGISGNGVDSTNNNILWTLAGDQRFVVVREGDLFDVDPGPGEDLRAISNISFETRDLFSGSTGGLRRSFSDSGLLTFELEFTDNSGGIFTAQLAVPVAGDFNGDGIVDGADFLNWQRGESPYPLSQSDLADWEANYGTVNSQLAGDFNNDGSVDGEDFLEWQRDPSVGSLADWEANYGMVAPLSASSAAVPEPGSLGLLAMAVALVWVARPTGPRKKVGSL